MAAISGWRKANGADGDGLTDAEVDKLGDMLKRHKGKVN